MRNWTFMSLFCGAGGGSLGFTNAGWDCVGAFDSDAEACEDHGYLTGHPANVVDLATVQPHEIAAHCTGRPDVVLTSPPCKGFSSCQPAARSKTAKYQQLNSLAERGVWLALEAWEKPPAMIVLENVPRVTTRGRQWLDAVEALLRTYGYACKETKHDCGEWGGLAQRRERVLVVARHMDQVPEFLHEPPKKRVRGIGEVIGELPVPSPDGTQAGRMHELPRLAAINWLRLALIPAGGDWRDLPEEVALAPRSGRQNGGYGVEDWDGAAHSVLAEGSVRNTRASIADPRMGCKPRSSVMGVAGMDEESATVLAAARHDNGQFSLADPRVHCVRREGGHGVVGWDKESYPVIAEATIHNWPAAVADPRVSDNGRYRGSFGVQSDDEPSATIRANHEVRLAPAAVVDPRVTYQDRAGAWGVQGWAQASHVIIAAANAYHGQNIADPRVPALVGPAVDLEDKSPTHLIIQAADGTWHRPMTTLELAALQGFPTRVRGEWLKLAGEAHGRWRQRIGNAIPPPTAEAIARSMADVLEAAANGTFRLRGEPVWVDGEERGATV